jgi:uncharacterized protein
VDRLRQDALALVQAFPQTLPELTRLGYSEAADILSQPVDDAGKVARYTDSVFNACVPLTRDDHQGILPTAAGEHHYPRPAKSGDFIRFDDFQLWVTLPDGQAGVRQAGLTVPAAGRWPAGPGLTSTARAGTLRRMAELSVPGLPFPLEPAGHPPCAHRVDGGTLTLTGQAGTDMFADPGGEGPPPGAGRLVGLPPDGDFTLACEVTVEFASTYDAGVMLLYAAPGQWAKLCFEYSPQHRPTAVTVVTRGDSDDANAFEVDGTSLWLRITRSGRAWAFHASTDGRWWRLLRYFSLTGTGTGAAAPVMAGFLAQSPTGQGCTARFSQIAFRPGAPAGLRDGS